MRLVRVHFINQTIKQFDEVTDIETHPMFGYLVVKQKDVVVTIPLGSIMYWETDE